MPSYPTALKSRLNEAVARVESLEREKKNAMAREKMAKTTVKSLLGDLREKNLVNEELKERLEFYSGEMKLARFEIHVHVLKLFMKLLCYYLQGTYSFLLIKFQIFS